MMASETWLQTLNMVFEPQFRVVICTTCRRGVPGKDVAVHLREQHQKTDIALQDVAKYLLPLELSSSFPKTFSLSCYNSIQHLPEADAFKCNVTNCNYIITNEVNMKRHVAKHALSRGYSTVKAQQLLPHTRSPYFHVGENIDSGSSDYSLSQGTSHAISDIMKKHEERSTQAAIVSSAVSLNSPYETSDPFWTHTKIINHVRHMSITGVHSLTYLSNLNYDPGATKYEHAIDNACNNLFNTIYSSLEHVNIGILCWALSIYPSIPSKTPLAQYQNRETWVKYTCTVKRMLLYIWRVKVGTTISCKKTKDLCEQKINHCSAQGLSENLQEWLDCIQHNHHDTTRLQHQTLIFMMVMIQQRLVANTS